MAECPFVLIKIILGFVFELFQFFKLSFLPSFECLFFPDSYMSFDFRNLSFNVHLIWKKLIKRTF